MSSELLTAAIEYLLGQRELYNINSLTVIRHGHIVADVTFYPYQPGEIHDIASVTKVVTSTLVGIAVDKGYISSVDERVLDFFPDRVIANLDDRKRAMTLKHLLTMTSGLELDEDSECTKDAVQCALDLPMVAEPGTVFEYFSAPPLLFSAIVEQTTGMNLLQFARTYLFAPLVISNAIWEASPNGHTLGAGSLRITPHDLARFAQMILQRGMWNGQRVVSEAWLGEATDIHVGETYGYYWNHYPEFPIFFGGGGAMGQRFIVSPDNDLVVVYTGFGYAHEDIEVVYLESLRSYILPAVQSDEALPANPAGVVRLQELTQEVAAQVASPVAVPPLPQVAAEISGRIYVFDVDDGYASAVFDFSREDEVLFSVTATSNAFESGPWQWLAGLDGVERYSNGRNGGLAAATAFWQDDQTLVMNIEDLGNLELLRLTFVFDVDDIDTMSVTVEDLWWWAPEEPYTLTGHLLGTESPENVEVIVSGHFGRSEGVAFNGEGDLYVTADRSLWRVSTGGEIEWIADMYSNLGIAPIGDRDLLVADFGPTNAFGHGPNDDGLVWRITPEGDTSIVATGIGDPNFVLVREDGSFLVSDDAVDEIWIVDNGIARLYTDSIAHPNGMVSSADGSILYVAQIFSEIDPYVWNNRIWALPLQGGEPAGSPELVCTTGEHLGPDGLAMDELGRIYVAANQAGSVLRVDPADGSVEVIVENLPGVASLAFGRGDFDHLALYATSTKSGRIWKIPVGVAGADPTGR
jgi:CubicO group peptidase (beta-lactamase class C family)/sugar lactone lactonase YvrE